MVSWSVDLQTLTIAHYSIVILGNRIRRGAPA